MNNASERGKLVLNSESKPVKFHVCLSVCLFVFFSPADLYPGVWFLLCNVSGQFARTIPIEYERCWVFPLRSSLVAIKVAS